ncbi:MAG: PilN domain-containing protein [Casimicrobiaceae bacterium]
MSDALLSSGRRGLFLDWWGEHLARGLPAALLSDRKRAARFARVSLTRDCYWPAGAKDTEARPLSSAPTRGSVVLLLDDANGFRRRVTLPIAVHRSVRQVLSHDLDRLTPLRANDLFFDARVVSRDWRAGTCVAELVAAPRVRVKQQIEAVEARGLSVERVVLNADDLTTEIDLLPAGAGTDARPRRGRILTGLLTATCLALLLALAVFPVWQARERVIALQAAEAQARIDAEQTSVLQRQVEKQLGEYNFLLQRKHSTPLVVQLLDDLSKRLPEDTWVQTLEIKSNPQTKVREVILQGETGSGARIVQLIAESPLIKEPALKAAMTRLAPNAERFHIGGELVLAELPEKVKPTEATSAVTVPLAPAPAAGAPTTSTLGAAKSADAKVVGGKTEPQADPKAEAKPAEVKPAEKASAAAAPQAQPQAAPGGRQ